MTETPQPPADWISPPWLRHRWGVRRIQLIDTSFLFGWTYSRAPAHNIITDRPWPGYDISNLYLHVGTACIKLWWRSAQPDPQPLRHT